MIYCKHFIKLLGRGLTAMQRMLQSCRAEHGLAAPFFRIKQHIFVMDNRLIWRGIVPCQLRRILLCLVDKFQKHILDKKECGSNSKKWIIGNHKGERTESGVQSEDTCQSRKAWIFWDFDFIWPIPERWSEGFEPRTRDGGRGGWRNIKRSTAHTTRAWRR